MWAYYIVSIKVKRILKHISSFFSFIVSRAVHVEFVSNLSTTEFIKSFNKLISRRGKPKIIYSDNAKTCMAEAKWLDSINRDKQFHDFLSKEKIIWKFNVSRAPWWRWQYERLIGLTKQSLYKSLGKSLLTWSELEEVLLDIKVNLNNLPVAYIEKDLEYFLLTPYFLKALWFLEDISSYHMILQKRKKLVIAGKSNRYMYINARKHLGEDKFMITW